MPLSRALLAGLRARWFIGLWLALSVLRAVELVLHYLRLDPNGMPVVARVDRFLPLALVVETGAIALVLLPFALWASRRPGRGVYRAALMVGCAYMVYATLDIEVYRYLRQHATWSLFRIYLRPTLVTDSTLLLSLGGDLGGTILMFGTFGFFIAGMVFSRRLVGEVGAQRHGQSVLVLAIIGAVLGSSLWWLNPSVNRRYRLLPPLYVFVIETGALLVGVDEPDPKAVDEALNRLSDRRQDGAELSPQDYPLMRVPLERWCATFDDPRCREDLDGDGAEKSLDCDDGDPNARPGLAERPSDGVDQDCDGLDERPMNIVLIVGESFHRRLTMAQWEKPDRLPHLKQLHRMGGTLFPNAVSSSFPSVHGAASIYLGIWSLPWGSIFGEHAGQHFKGFPEYLPASHYRKYIVSGADPTFDNQASWFTRFYDAMTYDHDNGQGKHDSDAFVVDEALTLLAEHPDDKAFLLTLNTHSTHFPFRFPPDYKPQWRAVESEERFAKALDYFDTQLGRLLAHLKRRSDFERTVFVLIGDHGFAIEARDFALPDFYGTAKAETIAGVFSANPTLFSHARTVDTPVSQVDIAPTILDLVGVRVPHHFVGASLLGDPPSTPELFFKNDAFSLHGPETVTYGHLDQEEIVTLDRVTGETRETTLEDARRADSARTLGALMEYLVTEDRVWREDPP